MSTVPFLIRVPTLLESLAPVDDHSYSKYHDGKYVIVFVEIPIGVT